MVQNDLNTTTNTTARAGRRVILLAAPVNDHLTSYSIKLFENFPDLGAPTMVCKIGNVLTYDRLLVEKSIDPFVTEVALIFFGHGEKDKLLGPCSYDSKTNQRISASTFFDLSHVENGPRHLFAFCSSAASELGEGYRDLTSDCTFVGFNQQIGLVLEDGEYLECWRKIMLGVAGAMFATTDEETLKESISKLYQDAISFFSKSKHQYSTVMRIFLRQQMRAIYSIRT